ncbi:kelch domain-containing protein 3 [Tetranychus urticae]|uniref:Kelch domain-containing protein n=1 Tax=Tetranychus urticae TaxID=32264 RepID=T1KHL1_TETUR|nr:kelch domain-containing protein 3 [Tetranychus urticae]
MIVLTRIEGGLKRVNHAAVAVNEHIYSFGGFAGTEDYSFDRPIDVYTLDMNTLRWEEIRPSDGGNPANVPCIRYGHTVVAQDDIIYLWGGGKNKVLCNKMFMFDTNTRSWLANEVKGEIPVARDGHSACTSGGFMYIIGGFEEERREFADTVYRFEFRTRTWQHLYLLSSDLLKKDFMSCVAIDDIIYLFGGRTYPCPFYDSEIMELDTDRMRLTKTEVSGYKPCGRRSHTAVVVNNKMMIFGGYNDVVNEHLNDFHIFDPEKRQWEPVAVSGDTRPTARRRHCCVAVNSYLYIFGGSCPAPEAAGALEHYLMELDDLYVIDTERSLRSMSLQAVIDHDLDTRRLPPALRREVECYRTDNRLACTQVEVLDLAMHAKRPP